MKRSGDPDHLASSELILVNTYFKRVLPLEKVMLNKQQKKHAKITQQNNTCIYFSTVSASFDLPVSGPSFMLTNICSVQRKTYDCNLQA